LNPIFFMPDESAVAVPPRGDEKEGGRNMGEAQHGGAQGYNHLNG